MVEINKKATHTMNVLTGSIARDVLTERQECHNVPNHASKTHKNRNE